MKEIEFVTTVRAAGARVFIVGGWVRDFLRQVPAHDKDYMVAGIDEEIFQQCFPHALRVGKAFPVYLVEIDGQHAEVAFARKEEKQGEGYRGFAVEYGKDVTLEEDLYRRDTTINSLAMELPGGEIFDFYGGRQDIVQGIIRPVSHHFAEDPVRALRAARQAAEFGFTLSDEAKAAMAACREELAKEPTERLLQELKRALMTAKPSVFFRALQDTNLLQVTFPELAALLGKTQPEAFHPEGDAFEHTMLVVDEVAAETNDIMARFCGLVHDLGKGLTPEEMLPHHYGHEEKGVDVLHSWNRRMTLPKRWVQAGKFVIGQHMRAARLTKPGKIVELLLKVAAVPLPVEGFQAIIRADHHSLPPYLEEAPAIIHRLLQVDGHQAPNTLKGPEIGTWVRNQQIRIFRNYRFKEI
ncbi:tRNA nucleotidyltransferase (CCA-adding enzyme) [Selenomonas ruminantium]|uniref:tRNA nucleotidyltransferase (CCA-adding enzyme) n=1 Tax=Selenomonas ruminantium TaxID=971 RepID=A0A1M6XB94_SELRU|nr:HD domain-containing protein [Selenomonas ruminantium]SHL03224.1 tRNA nucleotidyltransferase (CCA-adding enzyme) [Selenomonas ruminantium]